MRLVKPRKGQQKHNHVKSRQNHSEEQPRRRFYFQTIIMIVVQGSYFILSERSPCNMFYIQNIKRQTFLLTCWIPLYTTCNAKRLICSQCRPMFACLLDRKQSFFERRSQIMQSNFSSQHWTCNVLNSINLAEVPNMAFAWSSRVDKNWILMLILSRVPWENIYFPISLSCD